MTRPSTGLDYCSSRIAGTSPVDLDDLYGSRIMVESLAIAVSTQRASAEDLVRLRELLVEMDRVALTQDVAAWEVPHGEFHDLLIRHVGDRLRRTAADLRDHGRRYRAQLLTLPLAWEQGAREHTDIVDAVAARDSTRAAELLALHYARTALTLITRLAPQHQASSVTTALQFVQCHRP
ncbi:GntR family transcriptional regulator [Nocardioides sp.]|uniref:GntR family transcriptional regulator n=1 Tax=Nocardioides sp. TaxID=35761 RepID=UPI003784ED7D